jgi:hypothetical protein
MAVSSFRSSSSRAAGLPGRFTRRIWLASPCRAALPGQPVALKFLRPAHRWKEIFRDALFFLTCQVSFAPRLRESALRSGLLTAELVGRAAESEGRSPTEFAHPLGYFWDTRLCSYVEIYTWEPGRTQRYAPDDGLVLRWLGWERALPDTEMNRKRAYMSWLAAFCCRLGAAGVARQFEWDSWISQANVLTRLEPVGGAEFVAVDWRVGLAVPFFLPLSPAHARLIWSGLRQGRRTLADWLDASQLDSARQAHSGWDAPLKGLANWLLLVDKEYRGALPDVWQNGFRFLIDPDRRNRVQAALLQDWERLGRITRASFQDLRASGLALWLFYGLGVVPFAGAFLQRLAGNADYRAHCRMLLTRSAYRRAVLAARRACDLMEWIQQGRISPASGSRLVGSLNHYLSQKILLAWLPSGLHRIAIDRQARRGLFRRWLIQPLHLLVSQPARELWLDSLLQSQFHRGVISEFELAGMRARLQKKRLQALISDMGYFAGLEIFSRLLYLVLGLYGLLGGSFWPLFLAALGPISPSGILRFFYIAAQTILDLPEVIRLRSGRLLVSRLLGLLLAPWRFIGNFSVPLEMFSFEPRASLVLAEYFTAQLVRHVPVFGGRGKLLEFAAFQCSFSLPLSIARAVRVWLQRDHASRQD